MVQAVGKQKTQTTQPLRNKKIITAIVIAILVIILGSVLIISQLSPDCEKIRQASAKEFQASHYQEAYEKLKPYVKLCSKNGSPVLRFKFLHGVATAAYKAKNHKAAMSYAKQADQLNRTMTVEQQDAVQKEAGDVGDILLEDYHYYPVKNTTKETS